MKKEAGSEELEVKRSVPPEKFTNGKITDAPEKAAGLKGVMTAIKHLNDEGRAEALATIMPKLNQFDGFDCPGCAWPDPDEKRSFLREYCENGAKAIAEETTTKKADPEFWAKYSVTQLTNFSDYELGKSGRITHPMVLKEGASHYEPISWDSDLGCSVQLVIKRKARIACSPVFMTEMYLLLGIELYAKAYHYAAFVQIISKNI